MASKKSPGSQLPEHSVLFVCWGNICRSPTAEAILKSLLEERGLSESWRVDSAGTGEWNLGDLPDPRTLKTLRSHGLDSNHIARLLVDKDFEDFKYIVVFDHKNIRDSMEMFSGITKERLILLGQYDSQLKGEVIEDPYYLNDEEFETTFQICNRACKAFLDSILSS